LFADPKAGVLDESIDGIMGVYVIGRRLLPLLRIRHDVVA
jgi:hypothetical protein